ncbi:AP-3 complex subunit mu-1-like [Xenia sp. Carnegie-2017]|uniref:AP-3 complex subunit mu-1-like n=1 Tax=Xenia sp. Carnegie-2017 TaxID=2897299 RepID=UPI001F03A1FB|nr:AP-3 complex subunit mu-1-like [Xenia sp. Carnegie-2017]
MSSHLPTGQLSNFPWRRTGVKYANNEIYFDVAESIDAIIDKQGSTIFSEIQGTIDCNCTLSGMPGISTCVLQILVSLKMSVFILVFASEDGRVNMLPLFAKPCVLFQEIENVVVTVPFLKQVLNLNLTTNVGTYLFDPIKKELSWEIGKIQSQTPPPNIKGNLKYSEAEFGGACKLICLPSMLPTAWGKCHLHLNSSAMCNHCCFVVDGFKYSSFSTLYKASQTSGNFIGRQPSSWIYLQTFIHKSRHWLSYIIWQEDVLQRRQI